MSNTLYLDETLTGFEREFAIESAKTDIAFQKLDALYEAVDATLKANYMEAELKVYAENGTYDDLATLYTEAESEASEKKGSIIGSMLKALGVFFDKLKKAIMSIFKKKTEAAAKKNDDLEVDEKSYKDLQESKSIGTKILDFFKGLKNATAAGFKEIINFIKNHKLLSGFVATGTLATGAYATRFAQVRIKRHQAEQLQKDLDDMLDGIDERVSSAEFTPSTFTYGLNTVADATADAKSKGGKIINKVANFGSDLMKPFKEFIELVRKFGNWVRAKVSALFNKGSAGSANTQNTNTQANTQNTNTQANTQNTNTQANTQVELDPETKAEQDRLSRVTNNEYINGTVKQISEDKITRRLMVALAKKKNMDMGKAEDREKLKAEVAPQVEEFKKIFEGDKTTFMKREALNAFKKKYGVAVESTDDILSDNLVYEAFVDYYIESCMATISTSDAKPMTLDSILDSI